MQLHWQAANLPHNYKCWHKHSSPNIAAHDLWRTLSGFSFPKHLPIQILLLCSWLWSGEAENSDWIFFIIYFFRSCKASIEFFYYIFVIRRGGAKQLQMHPSSSSSYLWRCLRWVRIQLYIGQQLGCEVKGALLYTLFENLIFSLKFCLLFSQ